MAGWEDVLAAVTSSPSRTVRGRITEVRTGDDDEDFGRPEEDVLVWRDGRCLRVDTPNGRSVFRSDGQTAWDFRKDQDRPDVRGVDDRLGMPYFGPDQLLLSRSRLDWLGGYEFTTPAGPVKQDTFAGRRCHTVDLAPPARKPDPLRIWVDDESGQMLGYRNEVAGIGAEFIEVTIGESLDAGLFTWHGPSISMDERQQILRAKSQALAVSQQEWFRQNVTARPLLTRASVDFSPESVHFDPEAGSFDSSSADGQAVLARRPRGVEQWTPNWGSVSAYVWSTPEWDWAAGSAEHHLDEQTVADLAEALQPGEPVDRVRQLS